MRGLFDIFEASQIRKYLDVKTASGHSYWPSPRLTALLVSSLL